MAFTKKDVVILYQTILGYQQKEKEVQDAMLAEKDFSGAASPKFKNTIAKNRIAIQNEYQAIEDAGKDINNIMVKYNEEAETISAELGTKDPKNGLWNFSPEKYSKFILASSDLKEKYKAEREGYEKQLGEYNTMLNDEVPFTPVSVSFDECPVWLSSDIQSVLLKYGILE